MRRIYSDGKGMCAHHALRLALPLAAAVALAAALLLPVAGSAQSQAVPKNTAAPSILGTPVVHKTLTVAKGTWSDSPTTITYRWLRCPEDAAAAAISSNCGVIPNETKSTYQVLTADVGLRIRARVTASNTEGSTSALSDATSVVTTTPTAPATGCPSGTGPMQIAQISPPARLSIDGLQVSPSVITGSTTHIVARFHVSACNGRNVQDALVHAAAVPFNQFSIPAEQPTGADGWITLTMQRLSGFPAARQQQLLVMFVRAHKVGESVLAGISSDRLISFRVKLSG
jgi:hypothetical protein